MTEKDILDSNSMETEYQDTKNNSVNVNNEEFISTKRNKNPLKLNTKTITELGVLLAFEMVLVLIGHFALALVPIDGFLVVEINFLAYFICYRLINFLYTYLLIILSGVSRFILGDNWVQVFAISSADITMFTIFLIITILWNFTNISEDKKIKKAVCFISNITISSILTAIIMVFLNNYVLFDLWAVSYLKNSIFWLSTIFLFNLLKYIFISLVYYPLDRYLKIHFIK